MERLTESQAAINFNLFKETSGESLTSLACKCPLNVLTLYSQALSYARTIKPPSKRPLTFQCHKRDDENAPIDGEVFLEMLKERHQQEVERVKRWE